MENQAQLINQSQEKAGGQVAPTSTSDEASSSLQLEMNSDRFAKLAQKEADLVKRNQQFKQQQRDFDTERKRIAEIKAKVDQFEEIRKTNPIQALKDIGFSETDIFNYLADNQPKELTTEELARKATQEEISKFQEIQKKAEEAHKQQQEEGAIRQYKKQIQQFMQQNQDEFEYINYNGPVARELVFDTCKEYFNQTGEVLDIKDACSTIEKFYEENDEAMMSLKKRQNRLQSNVDTKTSSQPQSRNEITVTRKPNITLNNNATVNATSQNVPRNETREEKKARLADKLKALLSQR